MGNTSKGKDNKGGSKDWMQTIINSNKYSDLRSALDKNIGEGNIEWLSPLEDDNYQEYQLNHRPIADNFNFDKNTFSSWWPFPRQPQWDAIGKTDDGTIILVEAKAHIKETRSKCRTTEQSYERIKDSLKKSYHNFSPKVSFDEILWMKRYYQIANRLFFWDKLQPKNKTILVFLNFYNVPCFITSKDRWDKYMQKVFDSLLGCGVSELPSGIKIINFEITKK